MEKFYLISEDKRYVFPVFMRSRTYKKLTMRIQRPTFWRRLLFLLFPGKYSKKRKPARRKTK
jgi:hypothetical protein